MERPILRHHEQLEVLKFIAQYPFEEFKLWTGEVVQFVKIDFKSLFAFRSEGVFYKCEDLVISQGFTSVAIKNKWRYFVANKMYKGEGYRANALKEKK